MSIGERKIDEALIEAHGAIQLLLMQGIDMGHIHEGYLRTCEHLIEHIRYARKSHPLTPMVLASKDGAS